MPGRTRIALAAVVTALSLVIVAAPASAGKNGPNNANAKLCQKGGWEQLARSDLSRFNSERQCVSYAAGGGTLVPAPADCPEAVLGTNAAGQTTMTMVFQDPDGLDTLDLQDLSNFTIQPLQPGMNFFQGTTEPVAVVATRISPTFGSGLVIAVTDVPGNTSTCTYSLPAGSP